MTQAVAAENAAPNNDPEAVTMRAFVTKTGDLTSDDRSRPLVVDLDGTLVRTDLLHEAFCARLADGPAHYFSMWQAFSQGRARLKRYLAETSDIDYAHLPYDAAVLDMIRAAKTDGRRVYLATAADEIHAQVIARHLGLFDGVFASDGQTNLNRSEKAQRLVKEFGEAGFDYIGNSAADLPSWRKAARAYGANVSSAVEAQLTKVAPGAVVTSRARTEVGVWLKALRVHHWVKNALIFVPVLTSHQFNIQTIILALAALVAFSLTASAVYVINDLIDLKADRTHSTKLRRPFAAGNIPIAHGVIVTPVLLTIAAIIAYWVSPQFLGVLGIYLALTTAYSLSLKRKMLVDIVVLAMLYTIRIVAGAVAIGVEVSHWLAMFSFFFFTGLALIKRYTELAARQQQGRPNPSNRNYVIDDLPVVGALAAAAGMNAVTIFALYISSDTVTRLYSRPELLWLIAPIFLYWFARCLMLAHRHMLDDDPVVFALKDRISLLAVSIIVAIILVAM